MTIKEASLTISRIQRKFTHLETEQESKITWKEWEEAVKVLQKEGIK